MEGGLSTNEMFFKMTGINGIVWPFCKMRSIHMVDMKLLPVSLALCKHLKEREAASLALSTGCTS